MNKSQFSLLRRQLDRQLQRVVVTDPPRQGWIRAIREGLGMTLSQLAKRLQTSKQGVARIEKAETEGRISMATLQRVAEALDCELRYVLLPKTSLEDIVRQQAIKKAEQIVRRTALHMDLEAQATAKEFQEQQIQELTDELMRNQDRRLWETIDD